MSLDPVVSVNNWELITSPERFEALKSEWDALWLSCKQPLFCQGFDYCQDVWRALAQPDRRQIFCLVGRDEGRMAAVWPFVVCRRLMWRFLRPMGATGTEYTDVLVSDDVDRKSWTRSAWQTLLAKCKSDVVILPYVRTGTELKEAICLRSRDASVEQDVGLFASLEGYADWQSYYNSLSKSHRKKHGNLRRRLADQGTVQFEVVRAGDGRRPGLVEWMLAQKRIWADRTDRRGDWLYSTTIAIF